MFSKPTTLSIQLYTVAKKETYEESWLQQCFNKMLVSMGSLQMCSSSGRADYRRMAVKCKFSPARYRFPLLHLQHSRIENVWSKPCSNAISIEVSRIFLLEQGLQDLVHRISEIILVGCFIVSAIGEKGEITWDKGFVRKFLCLHKKLSQILFNVFKFFFFPVVTPVL